MRFIVAFLLSFLLMGQNPAHAFYAVKGDFTFDGCYAYSSLRKKSNPVPLEAGKVYEVFGLNKIAGDYVSIKVDGKSKWVNKNCGQLNPTTGDTSYHNNDDGVATPGCPVEGCADEYVLAISWQPGFCQTKQSKPECISQRPERYDATNLTLHGLWPDRISYCGVSSEDKGDDKEGEWDDLDPLSLDEQTTSELEILMPGVQSYLHRHEWIKHGTCDGRNEDTYYDISLDLLKQVNDSEVQELFAENIGQRITRSQIEAAFERSFGEGAGKSVKIVCKDSLVTELQIKMRRPLVGDKLADILLPTRGGSCNSMVVDPVGF